MRYYFMLAFIFVALMVLATFVVIWEDFIGILVFA